MRNTVPGTVTVRAISGTHVVFLAFDMKKSDTAGLMGFATYKNSSELQELCWQKGHNWNNLPARWKRGTCIVREGFEVDGVQRHRWVPDFSTPVFTKSREYIERLLEVESD